MSTTIAAQKDGRKNILKLLTLLLRHTKLFPFTHFPLANASHLSKSDISLLKV
jgi:hypothetical protein